MSVQEIQSLAQQFCDAFNKKDLKAALNLLSDDLEVFDHVPYRFDNKAQFAQFLAEAMEGVASMDFGGKSKCCGFPILTANEDNSLQMASDHTSEAKSKGADCMVTPCPLYHLNLDGNQPNAEKKTKKQIGLPILHLPQLVGLALGFDEQEMELQRHIVPTEAVARKVKVNMLS